MTSPLTAREVAAEIRATLAGKRTKLELARWAFLAWLDCDEGRCEFDSKNEDAIAQTISDPMSVDFGPEFIVTDDELLRMAEALERLDP